ncbi:uncharacterized protein LOC131621393 [Vicia villosa]|uniref:uncharacterized protein LOC131621393 n=1 Tax=Vicia villosa TaxID=3911 RepID=UPI00273CB6A9|nr:uncharacterized protein LOC131621393 [Vicia villosa]
MDLQKAYDTLEWRALEDIMKEMSFPIKFINWIMICITSVSYKYSINGQHSKYLASKRGLRQGDPISPLLFVLVMEYMHRCMRKLQTRPDFKFHPKCAKLSLTNICFADDLILFARGDKRSVAAMMEVFQKFSDSTGLKANPAKCKVYTGGIDDNAKQELLQITGFQSGELPFKYLGVPLSCRKLSIQQCLPLIDRIVGKIKHWTTKILSYAGRKQLIRSVLFAVTSYWMQVFPLPKSVLKHIEAICRSYLWSNTEEITRRAPIAWDNVYNPVRAGGLSITSLREWNIATIGKLLWNLQSKADKLWVRWVNTYFLKEQDVMVWQPSSTASWLLRSIVNTRDECRVHTQNNLAWEKAELTKVFNTAANYRIICGDSVMVPWKHIFYQNRASPRAKFTLWLAMLGGLSTKDRMERFRMIHEKQCCFCLQQETLSHLYFDCAFTGTIWERMLAWNGYFRKGMTWDSEKDWLIEELSKKGWRREILRITLAETVYHIWQERNGMIFKHTNPSLDVIRKIKDKVIGRSSLSSKLKVHVNASNDSLS